MNITITWTKEWVELYTFCKTRASTLTVKRISSGIQNPLQIFSSVAIAERKKRRKKSGKENSDEEDLPPEEKFIGFATNMQLKDSELYSKRWGIETGYRMIEEMRARTRSTKTVSRIFCFLYSVVMFNAWVMINAMLSAVSKPVKKTRKRITQTQLRIEIMAVLARHEPDSKTPPGIGSLYPY